MIMQHPVLSYYDISPTVTAFSTTRHGGCSEGEYSTLNVNEYCGDTAACVAANREALCKELGIATERLVMPHQVHGVKAVAIGKDFLSLSASSRKTLLDGVDALVTNLQGICIGVSTADCIPIIIYDPEHHAAAAIHAGWRGTVAGIVRETVRMMKDEFCSEPHRLMCQICPGISLDNFEVGQEVYDRFAQAGHDMSAISRRQGKWHIDLKECNRLQLVDLGVKASNIRVSHECTFADNKDYFSARRQGTASGRIFTGVILK